MQAKTKRKRLSRGGRWTEEERLRLLQLRDRNKHLAWDQFQKVSSCMLPCLFIYSGVVYVGGGLLI